jgi:RNA methyltransferase, TrmH family
MLSKARIKFIKSLQLKKYRKQEQCFVVEGEKSVLELLASDFAVQLVVGTADFFDRHSRALNKADVECIEAKPKELEGLGDYSTNNAALAVARMRLNEPASITENEFVLMLDDIRDPGNLGTIIRTADWYGIKYIVASAETADVYNAKVIQATMGSFTRVHVYYTHLKAYLQQNQLPVFGAFLEGKSVHTVDFGNGGIIVMGNEANGISNEVEQFITQRITIPRYGLAESLNAAIATAVICDNIRRRG